MSKQTFNGYREVGLDGWVKTANHLSRVGIFLDLYSMGRPISQNVITDTLSDNKEWQKLHIQLTMGVNVDKIWFGGILNGKGDAWFDDFSITLDSMIVKDKIRQQLQDIIRGAIVESQGDRCRTIRNSKLFQTGLKYANRVGDLLRHLTTIG